MVKPGECSGRFAGAAAACALLAACAGPDRTPAPAPGPAPAGTAALSFESVTTPAAALDTVWRERPDGVIAVAGRPSGYIATTTTYGAYRLHVEWRWPGKPGNGGVLLHIASGPRDGVWPVSLQVQTKHGVAGDLLPMAGARFTQALTSAPGAYPAIKAHTAPDSERPAGDWNSMDVVVRGGAVDVAINGVAQNHVSGVDPAAGRIGFQLEGAPYELRALRIEPLAR